MCLLHQESATILHTSNTSIAKCHKRIPDPDESKLGNPKSSLNWLCDSGAMVHMTPQFADLVNAVQVDEVNVEVADGYIVPVTATGQ